MSHDIPLALPPGLDQAIADAVAGDSFQWGYLYSLAGVCLAHGHALPEPLRSVIAGRLTAVGAFLTQPKLGDLRHVVDILVESKGPRKTGPRTRVDRTAMAAEAVEDMLAMSNKYGRRKAVTELAAAVAGVSTEALDKRVTSGRKAKKKA